MLLITETRFFLWGLGVFVFRLMLGLVGKGLCELGSTTDRFTVHVEDVDGNCEDESDTRQDCRWI